MPEEQSKSSWGEYLLSKGFYALVPLALVIVIALGVLGKGTRSARDNYIVIDGEKRVVINYWERWTDFEAAAMQTVVNKFNSARITNSKGMPIYVRYQTFSEIDRKLLISISGNSPPDICGIWNWMVYQYAPKRTLMDLTDILSNAGYPRSYYLTNYYKLMCYNGRCYAGLTTPASLALHWNKQMFREAGLDPNRPPRTIAELDDYAQRLTIMRGAFRDLNHDGFTNTLDIEEMSYYQLQRMTGMERPPVTNYRNVQIKQMGFHPAEPGWYPYTWVYYFGGDIWNGSNKYTLETPQFYDAYAWVQSFTTMYGYQNVEKFLSARGSFNSPQNPFVMKQFAMVIQGVWMYNFITKYSEGNLEWGAAPFPSEDPNALPMSLLECDGLVIPVNSPHPEEAIKFLLFTQRQDNMELLCLGQRKHSPLTQVSEGFYEHHPNPYIKVFRELAESPASRGAPQNEAWNVAVGVYWQKMTPLTRGEITPQQYAKEITERAQPALDRALHYQELVERRLNHER